MTGSRAPTGPPGSSASDHLSTWLHSWKEGGRHRCVFTGLGPTLTALFLAILTLYKAPKTAVFECLAVCDLFIPTVSTREKSLLPCKEAKRDCVSCLHLPRKMWHRCGSTVTDFSWHFPAYDGYLQRRRKTVGPHCGKKWALNHTSTYRLIQQQQRHCTEQSGTELCKQGGSNSSCTWCLAYVDSMGWKGPRQQESPGGDVAEDHLVSTNRNSQWEQLGVEWYRGGWTSRVRVQIPSTVRAAVTQTFLKKGKLIKSRACLGNAASPCFFLSHISHTFNTHSSLCFLKSASHS